ncbi:hypothetical protein GQ42DRAFT_153640 [Ramicandelaber brevisporus]|nr:hypothetical protein GQ42DRAFT_153640 [Ramicandelaber brevisporus]
MELDSYRGSSNVSTIASDHPAALSSNTTTPTTNIIASQSFVPTAATATVPAPASTLALAPASAVAPGQQTNTFNTNTSAPSGPVTAARTEQQRGTASRAKTSNFTTAGKALMLEAILKYRPYMLLAKDMWALYEVIADELNETGQCQTSSRHCRRNLVNLFDEYASNPLGVAEMFGGEHTQAAKNMKRIYEEMTGKAEAPADELLHQNEALQRLAGISGHDAGGDNDVEHDGDGSENAKTVTPDSAANRQSSKATLPSQSTVSTPAGQHEYTQYHHSSTGSTATTAATTTDTAITIPNTVTDANTATPSTTKSTTKSTTATVTATDTAITIPNTVTDANTVTPPTTASTTKSTTTATAEMAGSTENTTSTNPSPQTATATYIYHFSYSCAASTHCIVNHISHRRCGSHAVSNAASSTCTSLGSSSSSSSGFSSGFSSDVAYGACQCTTTL